MLNTLNKILGRFHLQLVQSNKSKELPLDFEPLHQKIWSQVHPYTMTSPERIFALIEATKYIVQHKVDGAVVECGVWKGGSMMTVIETLKHLHATDRELYLYDTFEGMSEPTEKDVDVKQQTAAEQLAARKKHEEDVIWAYSPLEAVQERMLQTGYNREQLHFIKGKVEETIPAQLPLKIALLRLDTDWYESTRHEMEHLFPLLAKGGVLIIDDYGHWAGAREAVDSYFRERGEHPYLHRIDETGRLYIKH